MMKIKISDFGPIKKGCLANDGWIEIQKNTFFIGNQGSGKSTLAKIISLMMWLEKSLKRGDIVLPGFHLAELKKHTKYHKIQNYFSKNTFIDYVGNAYHIRIDVANKKMPLTIEEIKGKNYIVPKIMYVPSERNFLSAISGAFGIKGLPENVFSFAEELKKAQKSSGGKKIDLRMGEQKFFYNDTDDSSYLLGKGFKIDLAEASSGFQSFVPLFLVSQHLCESISEDEEVLRKNLSVDQTIRMNSEIAELVQSGRDKSVQASIYAIRSKYYNRCFINVVEEPEQNLYPETQWQILKSLLAFNNRNKDNKLIITTHSPYLINYLAIAVKGYTLWEKSGKEHLKVELEKILPEVSAVNPDDLVIYMLDDKEGVIRKLDDYEGIPSDENYLNVDLGRINDLFINLLEIEDQCK